MEDLSRELEKELKAHSRPVPVKKKVRSELYFIDDFGKMNPAAWIRPLLYFLVFWAFVSTSTAVVFVYLFINGSNVRTGIVQQLHIQEQTIQKLVHEKEVLMARLVLSGKTPGLSPDSPGKTAPAPPVETIPEPVVVPAPKPVEQPPAKVVEVKSSAPEVIAVEDVRVMTDKGNGDLLVRFDIKNLSDDLDTVSGYIFVILKPAKTPVSDWLILPSVGIAGGRPAAYKKGQYFSIAHFKPVNFRVKTDVSPDFFRSVTVFVYAEGGELVKMQDILLSETGE